MEKKNLYTMLTYAGTLPFIACALMPYIQFPELPGLGSFDTIAIAYGLVIISFMAGAHWGSYLFASESSPINLFISSNIIAVLVWLTFLAATASITLSVFIAAFLYLLWVDYRLLHSKLISAHYFQTRFSATAVAVVALLLIIVAL